MERLTNIPHMAASELLIEHEHVRSTLLGPCAQVATEEAGHAASFLYTEDLSDDALAAMHPVITYCFGKRVLQTEVPLAMPAEHLGPLPERDSYTIDLQRAGCSEDLLPARSPANPPELPHFKIWEEAFAIRIMESALT